MSRRLRRRITVWTAAAALGCGLLPQSASACRILQFPADARADADAVAIVELIEVTPQDDNTFGAKAVARRLAFGVQAPESFEFENYSRGASCGPRPQIGDLWVVYLMGEGAAASITAFYPFETAEGLDRRVVGSVAESGSD